MARPSCVVPENILRSMSAEDRKAISQLSAEEAVDKAARRLERQEHNAFASWLQLRGIPFVHARTDKRSTIAVGFPDFLVLWDGRAVCFEFKAKGGRLSDGQKEVIAQLGMARVSVFLVPDAATAIQLVRQHFGEEVGR